MKNHTFAQFVIKVSQGWKTLKYIQGLIQVSGTFMLHHVMSIGREEKRGRISESRLW